MSWLTNIISGGVDKIVDSVGAAIDRVTTSDEERLILKNEMEKVRLQAQLEAIRMANEADNKMEEEVSERWKSDMTSDEPLAKRVRPLSLIYLLIVVSIMAFADGNVSTFTIKAAYIDLFQALLMLVFGAYFGSRGLEKIYQIKKNK